MVTSGVLQKTCQCLGAGIVQISVFPFYWVSDEKGGSCTSENGKPQHNTGQKWVEHNGQCLLVQIKKQFSMTCCIDSKKGDAWSSEE